MAGWISMKRSFKLYCLYCHDRMKIKLGKYFCSTFCRSKYHSKRSYMRWKRSPKVCRFCQKTFKPYPGRLRICSKECMSKLHKKTFHKGKLIRKTCLNCLKKFQGISRMIFCSASCCNRFWIANHSERYRQKRREATRMRKEKRLVRKAIERTKAWYLEEIQNSNYNQQHYQDL